MANLKNNIDHLDRIQGAILNSLVESISVLNLDAQIVFVNRAWKDFARENGYRDSTYGLGENYLDMCVSNQELQDSIRDVLNGKAPEYSLEYPCHSPTEKRWFILYAAPLLLDSGQRVGATISHINITARKLAEEKAQSLQDQALKSERLQALTETAGAAAHEINQPLTALIALSDMLLASSNLPEKDRDILENIQKGSLQISEIVKKMQQIKDYVTKPYIGETQIVDFDASQKGQDT